MPTQSLENVRSAVAEVLEVDPSMLKPETCFYDLPNFDSVQILSLLVALDDIGVEVPREKAGDIRTFGDVLALAKLQGN